MTTRRVDLYVAGVDCERRGAVGWSRIKAGKGILSDNSLMIDLGLSNSPIMPSRGDQLLEQVQVLGRLPDRPRAKAGLARRISVSEFLDDEFCREADQVGGRVVGGLGGRL